MPQPTSIPPLIPLPDGARSTAGDDKEDIFATLFTPATPRASPILRPVPDEPIRPVRHSRSASIDSEFGSFVSVPSSEDPLHQLDQEFTPAQFSPAPSFEFFDRFTEDAKAATERNKKDLLDELFQNELDPASFLRTGTTAADSDSQQLLIDLGDAEPRPDSKEGTPRNSQSAATSRSSTPIAIPVPPIQRVRSPLSLFEEELTKSSSELAESLDGFQPAAHQDDRNHPEITEQVEALPSIAEGPLLELESSDDEHLERTSRHPSRRSNWTESSVGAFGAALTRTPSLPTPPVRASTPEVHRAQSFFTPASSFPTRWVSSLLLRPAPPPPPKASEADSTSTVTHGRAASISGLPITHGTPFASHPFLPPSGAPGFTGDRSWDKGFKFDKENIERTSIKLIGRKEATISVLTVAIADKIRPYLPALKRLPRSWSLLYSLDQHGISLNTLYTRCEAHMGSALLVLRDSNDAIFGAWMGEGIKLSKGAYYGTGESFLWKVLPDGNLRVFKWTGKNDYVALCEPEYISFGGGDGHYGLYLDDTLSDGSSAHCPTFENEPLCSAGPRQGEGTTFECVGLEVWGVG